MVRIPGLQGTWTIPLLAVVCSILITVYFSGDRSSSGPSPANIERVTTQVRERLRARWRDHVRQLAALNAEMQQLREERLSLLDQGLYKETFLAIAAETHSPVDISLLAAAGDPEASLWTVFEAAKALELQMINAYRDVRAVDNAIQLEVPAVDAVSWVKVVPPRRRELDRAELDRPVISRLDELDSFRHQVLIGASELDAMVQQGGRILDRLREGEGTQQGEILHLVGRPGGGSDAGNTLRPNELDLSDPVGDGGFEATPGRVIDGRGELNDWMYVDKWYVMGPFPNQFRTHRDASFLPETVVDLDNVTIGMDDQEIRWRYWDAQAVRIEPAFAPRQCVYYAWTEVWIEEAGRYWVAMGSDDFGKVWINGDLVWTSSYQNKTWRANERMQEVELRQGLNEILFRCENNGGTMGWSVVIATMPNH